MKYNELKKYPQFIIQKKGYPIDHLTLRLFEKDSNWLYDSKNWLTFETAKSIIELYGLDYNIGFILTDKDPFFCIDIDGCLQSNGQHNLIANTILNMFTGALVEISRSGKGYHVWGVGSMPSHSCKNTSLKIELYHEKKCISLGNMNSAIGDESINFSPVLPSFIGQYFPPSMILRNEEWTTHPTPEYTPFKNNEELIKKALSTKSISAKFKNTVTFCDLWENNIDKLSDAYPPMATKYVYDQSSADAGLAQHLAFWCGVSCEHILQLMWCSNLVRDKWVFHKNYLHATIIKATSIQKVVYTAGKTDIHTPISIQHNVKKLQGSKDQIAWANSIREEKLLNCGDDIDSINSLCIKHGPSTKAGFWIDHKDESPQELNLHITPIELIKQPLGDNEGPKITEGYQFLSATQQVEHFKNCVYVQNEHRVFVPGGALLKSEQFNATYGGYVFQLDGELSGSTTKKAFEAFTESQIVRYPKAELTCFKPEFETGKLIEDEGRILVNTYVPINTKKIQGDVTPFLTHLEKIMPKIHDREIILSYMAACIQHKGYKFQWCPLIQGVEGNGKTLLTRVVAFSVGERYSHWPFAKEITEKFNDWLFDRIFIGVEDIVVFEHRQEIFEILKPMITNDRLPKRAMQQGQVMHNVCANFMLNMNPKSGFKVTYDNRRYAPFYTAQQSKDDIYCDGMSGSYFPKLYRWLRKDGYAIINNYLTNYAIPIELNPALGDAGGLSNIAPETSSSNEAHKIAMGSIEQEITAAIEEGRQGFSNGWISSMALERLLQNLHVARRIPRNKRREMLISIGYDWHPGLDRGRVNNKIPLDGGKPRLFIKIGHIHSNLTSMAEIIKAYQESQRDSIPAFVSNNSQIV